MPAKNMLGEQIAELRGKIVSQSVNKISYRYFQ